MNCFISLFSSLLLAVSIVFTSSIKSMDLSTPVPEQNVQCFSFYFNQLPQELKRYIIALSLAASLFESLKTIQVGSSLVSFALSSDGKTIFTVLVDGTGHLWDTDTGQELQQFGGDSSSITSVAFNFDGKIVLTGLRDSTACLWEVSTGKELQRFSGHVGEVTSVALSPDGRTVLTGSKDCTARLWEAATGKELKQFRGHSKEVISVALSPNGALALTGSEDTTARLWDSKTGKQLNLFKGHVKGITSLVFSPDSSAVLTGSLDGTACLWSLETGTQMQKLYVTQSEVTSVAFSLDSQMILTGCSDGITCCWDGYSKRKAKKLASVKYSSCCKKDPCETSDTMWQALECIVADQELQELEGHKADITTVAFSLLGDEIITASSDGVIIKWAPLLNWTPEKEAAAKRLFKQKSLFALVNDKKEDASKSSENYFCTLL